VQNEYSSWHLDKRVPIAIMLALLGQTVAFGWYAASWKADMERWRHTVDAQMSAIALGYPTTARDVAVLNERVSATERGINEVKLEIVRRLDRQDIKLDQIAGRLDSVIDRQQQRARTQ
jgi:hypothetical protein